MLVVWSAPQMPNKRDKCARATPELISSKCAPSEGPVGRASFEPGTFFLVRSRRSYFYLCFLFDEARGRAGGGGAEGGGGGSERFILDPGRLVVFSRHPCSFPTSGGIFKVTFGNARHRLFKVATGLPRPSSLWTARQIFLIWKIRSRGSGFLSQPPG